MIQNRSATTTINELKLEMKKFAEFSNAAQILSRDSIIFLNNLCKDPDLLLQFVNNGTLDVAMQLSRSFHTLFSHKLRRLLDRKQTIDQDMAQIPNRNFLASAVSSDITTVQRELKELEDWYQEELVRHNLKNKLILSVKIAIQRYVRYCERSNQSYKSPSQLCDEVNKYFNQLCLFEYNPKTKIFTITIRSELLDNSKLLAVAINDILLSPTTLNNEIPKQYLITSLIDQNINVKDNQIYNDLKDLPYSERLKKLVDTSQTINIGLKLLHDGLRKENEFILFYRHVVKLVIDALKFRRDRTSAKPNHGFFKRKFINSKLSKSRAKLIDDYICELEYLGITTQKELHVLLTRLYKDNSSNKLPKRFVDKVGGLHKLLERYMKANQHITAANNNGEEIIDLSVFEKPAEIFRNRIG